MSRVRIAAGLILFAWLATAACLLNPFEAKQVVQQDVAKKQCMWPMK